MEAYFQAFVNFKQNDWTKIFPMTEIMYNNVKNASTNHMFFELNCGYYPCVLYKKDVNFCFKLKVANKLAGKLRNFKEK